MLKMLRTEYDNKGSPIAELKIEDANVALKTQVLLYVKGLWPFDRPVRRGQGPYEWWKELDESSDEAQPLAVSIEHLSIILSYTHIERHPTQFLCRALFAVVPNSMVDERTQSTYTWMNSYLRNRQQVATVTRMIKIRNYCRYKSEVSLRPTLQRKID